MSTKPPETVTIETAPAMPGDSTDGDSILEWGNEAPFVGTEEASTNFFWTFGKDNPGSFQTTVRGNLPEVALRAHLGTAVRAASLIVHFGGKLKLVGEYGSAVTAQAKAAETPKGVSAPAPVSAGAPAPAAAQARPPAQTHSGAAPATPRAAQPAPAQSMGEAQSFLAERFSMEMLNGKPSFKVFGGAFKKFGVRCWPEVLEAAGYDTDSLVEQWKQDPTIVWGFGEGVVVTAQYALNENGKPLKVLHLIKDGDVPAF